MESKQPVACNKYFSKLHYTFENIIPPNDHDFQEVDLVDILKSKPLVHLFSYSILDSGLLNQNIFFVMKKEIPISKYVPFSIDEAQQLINITITDIRSNTHELNNMKGVVYIGTRKDTKQNVIGISLPQNNYKNTLVNFVPFYPGSFDLTPSKSFEVSNGLSFIRHMYRTRFCSACGVPCDVSPVGRYVTCSSCKKNYYLKCDLASIGIILNNDKTKCVLGRRRDLWALISGFNECGESPMDCMIRECKEEIGIDLDRDNNHVISLMDEGGFSYWATSGSYMFGFRCICRENEELKKIEFDKNEIPDAAWFTREEVLDVMMNEVSEKPTAFKIPGRHTLARRIIEHWVFEGHDDEWTRYNELISYK